MTGNRTSKGNEWEDEHQTSFKSILATRDIYCITICHSAPDWFCTVCSCFNHVSMFYVQSSTELLYAINHSFIHSDSVIVIISGCVSIIKNSSPKPARSITAIL